MKIRSDNYLVLNNPELDKKTIDYFFLLSKLESFYSY